jgi:hypothetical protein
MRERVEAMPAQRPYPPVLIGGGGASAPQGSIERALDKLDEAVASLYGE